MFCLHLTLTFHYHFLFQLPIYLVVTLGCYGLLMVGVGLMRFPICPQEAVLLQKVLSLVLVTINKLKSFFSMICLPFFALSQNHIIFTYLCPFYFLNHFKEHKVIP